MAKNDINRTKLQKILAMTHSSHDGEALAALRAVQRMLSDAGLGLSDLSALNAPKASEKPISKTTKPAAPTDFEKARLKRSLQEAQATLEKRTQKMVSQDLEITDLVRQVTVLKRALAQHNAELSGWRERAWQLAWEKDVDADAPDVLQKVG